ncbi:MAG: GNAT family N-acetyltransferase [Chlorobia bacterium]|nr:GNAT family N-acetyltransferase [Fimbriimonadaceae bacterium]
MATFTVRALAKDTWPAFAELVERDGGIWGGCWCIGFHLDPKGPKAQCKPYRETKERLVCQGHAHAALVFDGETAVGWCQFGPTAELPNIKHRKQYEASLEQLPDWRITCFYVGKGYRKRGVANLALQGALEEMARLGGGVVEAYPEDVDGRKTSSSFLHGGTVAMFERLGFERVRRLGMHHWVVSKVVACEGVNW